MGRLPCAVSIVSMLAIVGCGTPDVTFEVGIPASVIDQATWVEIGAFPNGVCPVASQLAGGLPTTGMKTRVAFHLVGPSVPMGRLAAGSYAFAAVARSGDCGVVAAGCTVVDITQGRDVRFTLAAVTPNDATKCAGGAVCTDARCVPPSGVDDPSFGAGCSMQLVGAGPLPEAVAEGAQISQPTVVPVGDGFLVAYTSTVQADGTSELTLFPIDHDGGPLALPTPPTLDGRCMGAAGDDATGLVLDSSRGGLLLVSRPTCGSMNGLDLFPLSPTGAALGHSPLVSASAELLSSHALALSSTAGQYVVAFRLGGVASLQTSDGMTTSAPKSFGRPFDTAARVARSSGIQIVEGEGAMIAAGDSGAPPPGTFARVHLLAATADPMTFSLNPDDQLAASVSTVAALGPRAFLITDGKGKGMGVDAFVRSYGLGDHTDVGFPIISGTGAILAIDAAAATDRLVVVTERQQSISAVVIAGAAGTPAVQTQLAFADDLRIPQTFVDGPVSVAATDSRVAVVWASRKAPLGFNDLVGGYAVFACR